METVWAGLGILGSVCFLTMGLPVLLTVGLAGYLSAGVWLPLVVAVVGVVGLAVSMAISGQRRRCAPSEAPGRNLAVRHNEGGNDGHSR